MKGQVFTFLSSLLKLRRRAIVWGLAAVIIPAALLVSLRQFVAHSPTGAPAEEPADVIAHTGIQDSAWWQSVQDEIRGSEYNVIRQEDSQLPGQTSAYQAPNRANNFRSTFTEAGIQLQPWTKTDDNWQWALNLTGFGYAGHIESVAAAAELTPTDNRIAYYREGITEWYVNGEVGLEQGFTIHQPPASGQNERQGDQLVLELAVTGSLFPELVNEGGDHGSLAVDFKTTGGDHVLRYSDLTVVDANEQTLPATMRLTGCQAGTDTANSCQIQLVINDNQAQYPITVDPIASSPDWGVAGDEDGVVMGYAVYTAGDVNGDGYDDVIVSAPDYDLGNGAEGRVYVYHGSANGPSTALIGRPMATGVALTSALRWAQPGT